MASWPSFFLPANSYTPSGVKREASFCSSFFVLVVRGGGVGEVVEILEELADGGGHRVWEGVGLDGHFGWRGVLFEVESDGDGGELKDCLWGSCWSADYVMEGGSCGKIGD